VPGTWSPSSEFFAIAESLGRLGRGVLESAPRYNEPDGHTSRVDEELEWMARLSRDTGRPFSFNLQQIESMGNHYRDVIALSAEANANGSQLRPQITPRGVGVLFSLAANTLIDDLPSFAPLKELSLAGRLDGLRNPEVRGRLIAEGKDKPLEPFMSMFLMRSDAPANYDLGPADSIAGIAAAANVTPIEAYIDAMVESDGKAIINWPVMNQDQDAIREQLTSPVTIMGLADAGAHATQIMDASQQTYVLSHWVRDKQALSLEEAVRKMSSDTADFIGYADRGRLVEGSFADLNVIDLDNLSLQLPEIVHDFPGDAPRFVQRSNGIEHTFVNGQHFMANGEHTGNLAGRLLRSN
jgi:N-acyl-D-aspartate/D-glutamate deacylase